MYVVSICMYLLDMHVSIRMRSMYLLLSILFTAEQSCKIEFLCNAILQSSTQRVFKIEWKKSPTQQKKIPQKKSSTTKNPV